MHATKPQDRTILHRRTAARTVVFYVIFASLWIYFSDMLLSWFISDPHLLTRAQIIKGWLYVVVTASLLYCYLRHCLQGLRNREEALEEEQSKAQNDIRERFNQLNTLFDSMGAIVYVADLETHELLYVNRFATEFFGQDWQGHKCYRYLQEGIDQPCDFCTNPKLISDGKSGEPVNWEFLNTRNNRWYECFDKAIRWTDGRLVRLEVALDVTERKELERIKDDLLSSMSHEMRTPLTAISGFAELLLNEPEIPEQHRRHVEIIYREAEKLTDLINRFLDVRRLKTDRTRINYERVPVQDLLEKALNGCRDCKDNHDIQVECQPALQVYGNRRELIQVIRQMVENACRYSPHGGKVFLTAQSLARDISIQITDQGIGIPQHELEAIFTPFHRLDRGDTRRTGGVGLGLSVAREIITLHGGQIRVKSTPGEGSTFTILLPLPVDGQDVMMDKAQDPVQQS
jgi:signal transduction histidine kinase